MYDPFKAKVHPAADIYPLIEGDEYKELRDSIHKNGLRDPVVLTNDGKFLVDGRNRLKVCRELKMSPDIVLLPEEYCEQEIIDFIMDHNSRRRHLTVSQLAAISAEISPLYTAAAKERQAEGGRLKGAYPGSGDLPRKGSPPGSGDLPRDGEVNRQLAKIHGIGHTTVAKAMKVKKSDKNLHKKIKAGKISVNQAAEIVTAKEKAKHVPQRTPEQKAALTFQGYRTRWDKMEKELRALCELLEKLKPADGERFFKTATLALRRYADKLEKL
jgi:ribosomal protein S13